jgi:hypothetical protein
MSCKRNSMLALASAVTLATALAATPLMPLRIAGFGPKIHNDASLNANLGVLTQVVAWQNSPDAHPYRLAESLPDRGTTFTRVALATIPNNNQ